MDWSFFTTTQKVLNGSPIEFAKYMRKNPTEAESILWLFLKNKQTGYKFRRQHPIGDYIVDFVNLYSGTIIEIDGGYHKEEQQKIYDETRTQYLTSKGYTVIRFSNEEVMAKPEEVINKIKDFITEKFKTVK